VGTSTHWSESSNVPSSSAVAPSTESQYVPTSRKRYERYEHENVELWFARMREPALEGQLSKSRSAVSILVEAEQVVAVMT